MAAWWALAWAPVGAILALWQWLGFYLNHDLRLPHMWVGVARAALEFGAWGALGGAGFALALMMASRRYVRPTEQITVRVAALSGALVAAGFPLVYKVGLAVALFPVPRLGVGAVLASLPLTGAMLLGGFAILGGAVAAGVLTIARRSSPGSLAPSVSHSAFPAPKTRADLRRH